MSEFSKIISKILKETKNIEESIGILEIEQKRYSGIICPKCGSVENKVTNVRNNEDFKIRRRKCIECGHGWNTEEIISNRCMYKKNEESEENHG